MTGWETFMLSLTTFLFLTKNLLKVPCSSPLRCSPCGRAWARGAPSASGRAARGSSPDASPPCRLSAACSARERVEDSRSQNLSQKYNSDNRLFQKNRNSNSLTVFGLFSGIVGQKNCKMNGKGIIFQFTIPHLGER